MRYLGWILLVLLMIFDVWFYRYQHRILYQDVQSLKKEIKMWQELMEKEKNARHAESKFSFPTEKFFESDLDKLTPYGEIELARILTALKDKDVDIVIYGQNPVRSVSLLTRFMNEQKFAIKNFRIEGRKQSENRFEIMVR